MALWLKANAGTSTTTDGGTISLWSDMGAFDNNLSQGSGGLQSAFRDNTNDNINFNPVVDFDGSGILGSATYNDFFTIERSKDATDWKDVSILDGAGNSSEKLNYSYEDTRPYSGISYYRLKQTDFDGTSSYSSIEVVDFTSNLKEQFRFFPNPTEHNLTIEIPGLIESELRIYDIYGRDVSSIIKIAEMNSFSITIDVSKLENGVYILQHLGGAGRFTKK